MYAKVNRIWATILPRTFPTTWAQYVHQKIHGRSSSESPIAGQQLLSVSSETASSDSSDSSRACCCCSANVTIHWDEKEVTNEGRREGRNGWRKEGGGTVRLLVVFKTRPPSRSNPHYLDHAAHKFSMSCFARHSCREACIIQTRQRIVLLYFARPTDRSLPYV